MTTHCRNGCWLKVVWICLILAVGCAGPLEKGGMDSKLLQSAKADFARRPTDIIEDSKYTLSRTDNLTALLLAGGATIAMNQGGDDDVEGFFDRHEVFHGFTDRSLKTLGDPVFHFAGAGLWYVFSADNGDDFNTDRAWTMVRALSLTTLTTAGLKTIRNNDTPVGNGRAWPSGHTSSSFAVASVLDEFYGPRVGICAYTGACLVGLRMMDAGDHWASDVVFGAVLGWVVGHSVAGRHKDIEIAGFKVLPFTSTSEGAVMGVNLVKRF